MLDQRDADRGGRGRHGRDAGHHRGGEPAAQPGVQVLVGAVERGIARAQDHNVAARLQVRGEPRGRFLPELGQQVTASRAAGVHGHRELQDLLGLPFAQVRLGGGQGSAAPVPVTVVGDDVGGSDEPGGPHREQLGVPRADPHAGQPARGRDASHAVSSVGGTQKLPQRFTIRRSRRYPG